jgi:UDP-glucose 4-epimerase
MDIADAHIRALHYLIEGRPSCAVNLANEQGYSVLEVIAAAERVTEGLSRSNMWRDERGISPSWSAPPREQC